MPLLKDHDAPALHVGDILRLPENYDLGPGSLPVDLIVFNPDDADCGLGLLVVSGYKAGLTYGLLPADSTDGGSPTLSLAWLRDNWDRWFCYEWDGAMRVIEYDKARCIPWNKRLIMEND